MWDNSDNLDMVPINYVIWTIIVATGLYTEHRSHFVKDSIISAWYGPK